MSFHERIKQADVAEAAAAAILLAHTAPTASKVYADYYFTCRDVDSNDPYMLHGNDAREGRNHLYFTGNPDVLVGLYGMLWNEGNPSDYNGRFGRPLFFGHGKEDWRQLRPYMNDKSFYIYLQHVDAIYEFPCSGNYKLSEFELGFDGLPRPAGVFDGAEVRVIVADSGISQEIKAWISLGGHMERYPRLPKPGLPVVSMDGLSAGQVSVGLTSDFEDLPVLGVEVYYNVVGLSHLAEFSIGKGPIILSGLQTGTDYEFSISAINHAGKSEFSDKLVYCT